MLALCPGCQRHVKHEEAACPFCGASLESVARTTRAAGASLTRAAAVFAGATVLAGCGKEPAPQPPAPANNEQMAVPAYGVPPPDTLVRPPPEPVPPPPPAPTPSASTSAKPIPLVAPAYGPPPNQKRPEPKK